MRRARIPVAVPLLWSLLAGTSVAQSPQSGIRALPDYDSRSAQLGAASTPEPVAAAIERLQLDRGSAPQVRWHPLTGAVRRIAIPRGSLTAPAAGTPAAIAEAFVRSRHDLIGLTADEAALLVRGRAYSSAGERLTHVYFDQIVDGIRVFEGVVGVHVDRDGAIVWLTNDTAPTRARTRVAVLSAEDAIRAAAGDVRPDIAIDLVRRSGPSGADEASVFEPGSLARPIEIRLVYFPARNGLRLAWQTLIEPQGAPQAAYVIVVDATNGRILYRRNTYRDTEGSGRVIQSDAARAIDARRPDAHPLGAAPSGADDPPGGCPPLVNYQPRDLTTPFRDPLTVLFDTGRLAGNNATVYLGSNGAWGAAGTRVGDTWSFDFPFNTAGSAETSVFFALNYAHDLFYDLGFDEAAGNFQVNDFGRGGAGGDPLVAIARAAGRNNANISTPPDGQSPTMNLFLFDGQGCWTEDVDGDGVSDLDGGYDNDIILHEYHHGVTFRLNPAWSGAEAGAIGEGGGDFFAYSVFDDPVLAEYAVPPDGIRRVNAKTYADWFCLFGLFCEVHDNGEIWANVLWDLRERFRTDRVGGSDDTAIREVHQIYVDGLKLSPAGPTMLDLRDAMLQADAVRNPSPDVGGSANYCRMWQTFARRGMGVGALDTKNTLDGSVVANFAVPAGCPGPPVVTIAVATTPAREAGASPATMTVSRTGATTSDLVVEYAVSGSATPGADYMALPGHVTIPAGDSSAILTLSPIDDTRYEINETVTVSLSTGLEYIVGSPSSATATIVSDDLAPDLTITAVSAPATGAAGSTVQVSDTTSNRGAGAAGTFITRFVLSTNLAIDAADIVLAEREIAGLGGGAASAATTGVTIPAGTAPGTYYVLVKADADDRVGESLESNNVNFVSLRIGPDLVVTVLSAPSTGGAGGSVSVTDTTTNQGAEPAGTTTTRFFLSTNTVLDGADRPLGGRAVGVLAPGSTNIGTTTLAVPAEIAPAQYFLLAQADADADVVEGSETNNTKFAAIRIGADLMVTGLTAPAAGSPGSSIGVTDTVANQGGGAAGASVTRFYLSANTAMDPGDALLDGSRAVPALAPGATSAGPTVLQIPTATPAGKYFLIAVADADATVVETADNNNTRYVLLTIGGDLAISSLTAPLSGGAGANIGVTDTTGNQGAGVVLASATRFYLSVDYRLSQEDIALAGGRAVPELAGGASSSGTTILALPSSLASRSYFLIAVADADGVVVESDESNNTRYVAIAVGPDLIVSTLSLPTRLGAGSSIAVTEATKNQGGGAAGASSTRFFLSVDSRLDASDVALGGARAVPPLAGGETSMGTTSVALPAATPTGAYYFIASADADGAVAEVAETNNPRSAYVRVGPDLALTILSAPASAAAGAVISVTDTTTNLGGGASAASVTRYYLSTDAYLGAGDIALAAGRTVPSLGADAGSTGTTTVTLPADAAPGIYYLIAKADGDQAVVETSETNNTRLRSIQVLAP